MVALNMPGLRSFVDRLESADELGEEDEAAITKWMTELADVDETEETDVENLRTLFRASKAIMQYEEAQANTALDEAEEQGRLAAEAEDKLERESQKFKEETSELRMSLAGESETGVADTTLRAEIDSLRDENDELRVQNRERDRELGDEREKSERQMSQIADLEAEQKKLKERVYVLQDTSTDLRRRLNATQESQAGRRTETEVLQKRLKDRQGELLSFVEDASTLTEANESLSAEVAELKQSLQSATKEMNTTSDRYIKLKDALRAADDAVDSLEKENFEMKQKLDAPMEEQKAVYEEMMSAVEKKIGEWKTLLAAKDERIDELGDERRQMAAQLAEISMDTDRASVAALMQTVRERDRQIESLRGELKWTTEEMDKTVAHVKSVEAQMSADGTGVSGFGERIRAMAEQVKAAEQRANEALTKATTAEEAAAARDAQLASMMVNIRKYEKGEFGLSDAIQEIERVKIQLGFRDKQLAGLNAKLSKMEVDYHECLDENDVLRSKLGLNRRNAHAKEQLDLDAIVAKEADKALNVILTKEIDKLEEERLNLKMQMRHLSKRIGERAAGLGLSAEDVLAIEQFTEDLKKRRGEAMREWKRQIHQTKASLLPADAALPLGGLTANTDVAAMQAQNYQLTSFNDCLQGELRQRGMQQIQIDELMLAAVQRGGLVEGDDNPLPTSHDAQPVRGDGSNRVQRLLGANEELRSQLSNAQSNLQAATVELSDARTNSEELETRLADTRQLKIAQLPDKLDANASIIVANLNEHLVLILQELSLKDDQLCTMETTIQAYQSKQSMLQHSQGLLYEEYNKEKGEWEENKRRTEEKFATMTVVNETGQIRIDEFDRLLSTLSADDSEVLRRLSEMTRKFTVMRINETTMTRKYNHCAHSERLLKMERDFLRQSMSQMEARVTTKLADLRKEKEMGVYEIASLHRAVHDSVTRETYDGLTAEHEKLAEQNRKLMQSNAQTMQKLQFDADTELLITKITKERDDMNRVLEVEKAKCMQFEVICNERDIDLNAPDLEQLSSIAKRVAVVEMRELNERRRAEHAVTMADHVKVQLSDVNDRNLQLESTVAELTTTSLSLQKSEQSLRDELADSVTKDIYESLKNKVDELETSEALYRTDIDHVKTLSQVALDQMIYWKRTSTSHCLEIESLTNCVRDLQSETDMTQIVGRLHTELLHVKLGGAQNEEEIVVMSDKLVTLEARHVRLQQRYDQGRQTALRHNYQYVHSSQQLRATIHTLRTRFAGCVSLDEQARMHGLMTRISDERRRLHEQLVKAQDASENAAVLCEELKIKQRTLEEVNVASANGGTQHLMQKWHSDIQSTRIALMKVEREARRSQRQVVDGRTEIGELETSVEVLETQIVKRQAELDDTELRWQLRVECLETQINNAQHMEHDVDVLLTQNDLTADGLPDPNQPLNVQLEVALRQLREYTKQCVVLRHDMRKGEEKKNEVEKENLRLQNRLISHSNLATLASGTMMHGTTGGSTEFDLHAQLTQSGEDHRKEMERVTNVLKVTQETYEAQLMNRDASIDEYKRLLLLAQENTASVETKYRREMTQLIDSSSTRQPFIADETGVSLDPDYQARHSTLIGRRGSAVGLSDVNDQIMAVHMKNAELQVELDQYKTANSLILEKLTAAREANDQLKITISEQQLQLDRYGRQTGGGLAPSDLPTDDRSALSGDYNDDTFEGASDDIALNLPIGSPAKSGASIRPMGDTSKRSTLASKRRVSGPDDQGSSWLEWKVKCDRLRDQLTKKKNENKALNTALNDLKSQLLPSPPPAGYARRLSSQTELDLLQAQELRTKVIDLNDQLGRQQRQGRRVKEKETELREEMGEMKNDMVKREATIVKLKGEKVSLEKEVDAVERRMTNLRDSIKMKVAETENTDLRNKLRQLETQIERSQGVSAEKPINEQRSTKAPEQGGNAFSQWEQTKRFQAQAERAKKLVEDKTKSLIAAEMIIKRLKGRVEKLESEKQTLHNMLGKEGLKVVGKGVSKPVTGTTSQPSNGAMVEVDSNPMVELEISTLRREKAENLVTIAKLKKDCDKLITELTALQNSAKTVLVENGENARSTDMMDVTDLVHRLCALVQQQTVPPSDENRKIYELIVENRRMKELVLAERDARELLTRQLETTAKGKLHRPSVKYIEQELADLRTTVAKLKIENDRLLQTNHLTLVKHAPGIHRTGGSPAVLQQQLIAAQHMTQYKERRITELESLLKLEVDKSYRITFDNRQMAVRLTSFETQPPANVVDELRQCRLALVTANQRVTKCQLDADLVDRHIMPCTTTTADGTTRQIDARKIMQKLEHYDRLMEENIELKVRRAVVAN